MAVLAECPICRKKQAGKNKVCKCGEKPFGYRTDSADDETVAGRCIEILTNNGGSVRDMHNLP